jgi:hypothetical protein
MAMLPIASQPAQPVAACSSSAARASASPTSAAVSSRNTVVALGSDARINCSNSERCRSRALLRSCLRAVCQE